MRTLSKIQVIILVLGLIVAIPFASYAAEGKIMIGQTPSTTFPIVIDTPGSYVLTSNLQVSTNFNCIQISADNVTLDLNGFALTGPGTGSGGSGIYVNGYSNITIMNGTVKDFRSSGIYFLSSAKIQLKDLKCTNNGQRGIYVENATVVNCIAEENLTDGIRAYYSTVKDCTSNDNTEDGIDVLSSTVLNCQAYSNTGRGIYSRRSSLTNCTVTFSGDHGIEASDSTLSNCTSYGNNAEAQYGIHLTDSIATGCAANENYYGFYAENSSLNNCIANMNDDWGYRVDKATISNCSATNNGATGFIIDSSSVITNSTANSNGYNGFSPVQYSVITNCTANSNSHYGIRVGSHNRIEGNNVNYNGHTGESGYGIIAESACIQNYVIKNTCSDNYSGNFVQGDFDVMPMTGDNANYSFTSP
jgi:hypothetical protein